MLDVLQENYIDWMHACGGKGRCTTCKAVIVEGADHLSEVTPAENKYREKGLLDKNERLTCQAFLEGDVTVEVPELYKLPHLNYSY